MAKTSNPFQFLAEHDPLLAQLGQKALHYLDLDPNTSMIKLRQFGEILAQRVAERTRVERDEEDDFHSLLERLWDNKVFPPVVASGFHALRREGNRAVHGHSGTRDEAATLLETAHNLARWFHVEVCRHRDLDATPPALASRKTRQKQSKKRTSTTTSSGPTRRTSSRDKETSKSINKTPAKKTAKKPTVKKTSKKKTAKKVAKKSAAKKAVKKATKKPAASKKAAKKTTKKTSAKKSAKKVAKKNAQQTKKQKKARAGSQVKRSVEKKAKKKNKGWVAAVTKWWRGD